MQNLKLTLEYDGTAYHGWQVQPGLPTIQGVLQDAVKRLTGEEVRIIGAGRTDAGVHALAQVANFRTGRAMATEVWERGLNSLLPPDIVVTGLGPVPDGFDARRSATAKTYRYSILSGRCPSALQRHFLLHVRDRLDITAMAEAATCLVGEHDFTAFRAADGEDSNAVRHMYEARLIAEGHRLDFVITGKGFLKHMIRIVVGTLLDVGRGKLTPAGFRHILDSQDRRRAGRTAPAHGLCLMHVSYAD